MKNCDQMTMTTTTAKAVVLVVVEMITVAKEKERKKEMGTDSSRLRSTLHFSCGPFINQSIRTRFNRCV